MNFLLFLLSFSVLTTSVGAGTKKVDFENVAGLELLIADGTDERFISRWGHALLRLIDRDDDPYNDQVIGFTAVVKHAKTDVARGAAGALPMGLDVISMGDSIREYMFGEKRSLLRVILPSTPRLLASLRASVAYYQQDSNRLGHYDFFTNNCASALMRLLADSGFGIDREVGVPTKLATYFISRLQTNMPPIREFMGDKIEPRFTIIPLELYQAPCKDCEKTYAQFVNGFFSPKTIEAFRQRIQDSVEELKIGYPLRVAANRRRGSHVPILLDQENVRSNLAFVRSLR